MVNVRFAAANRDEREFSDADKIDLDRAKPGRHLGFGSGTHHCIGAPLARRELFWAFHALVNRVNDKNFCEGRNSFECARNFSLRALTELHIEFQAVSRDKWVDPSAMTAVSKATDIANPKDM